MKKKNLLLPFLLSMGLFMFSVSCSEDDPDPNNEDEGVVSVEVMDKVIATYVDKVVIPTYADMEDKVGKLKAAVDAFLANGTQDNLDKACAAWRAARTPWEESEAFLFGPADYESLDPSLDSWPLDKDGIDQILSSGDWGEIEGDEEDAQSLRGFHTIEYLLFDGGTAKTASAVSVSEKSYMQRVANKLLEDTERLHLAWKSGLETEEVPQPFGEEFKKHTSSRFPSAENVLSEIIDGGIKNIAEEVGDVKIGNPYSLWGEGKQDDAVLQVESWYSWNSLEDYENNIISIENSYLGGRAGNRDDATSFSAMVRSVNEELDNEVKKAISDARAAISGIPHPFRENLGKTTEIVAAMDACAKISLVFDKVKTALEIN
jgi:predicted lipoprotein